MTSKERLIGLLKYVEELARMPEKTVYSVRSYRSMMYFEHQLRGRLGIQHDVADEDGTVLAEDRTPAKRAAASYCAASCKMDRGQP